MSAQLRFNKNFSMFFLLPPLQKSFMDKMREMLKEFGIDAEGVEITFDFKEKKK